MLCLFSKNGCGKIDGLTPKIKTLKNEGKTYMEIAKIVGLSKPTVMKRISKNPKRKSGICEGCNKYSEPLHRHHTDYLNDKVIYLCLSCHCSIHNPEQFMKR